MNRPEADERPFAAPWEAQAFALTVTLAEQGYFGWSEWTATLAAVLREAAAGGADAMGDAVDEGRRYYHFWLEALERLVVEKGLVGPDELAACAASWAQAYRDTPHGRPVTLA